MAQAKQGDTVNVHYTGRLDDDTIFETSQGHDPMQFTVGVDRLLPAFEETVIGMNPGESRTTKIPSAEAYGPYHEEMVIIIDRQRFPDNLNPEIGQELEVHQSDGQIVPVLVTDVSESSVTLDGNHPLAGKDLTFDIQLVEIL
ncbi:MAG: peptidylprolyl isomerase [Dehalococcoidia bacterium]|nr:MAG: peptidylprolyl isomerase [Dehalococcoidia bacterium]